MVVMGTTELEQAIVAARAQKDAIMARPIRVPLAEDNAKALRRAVVAVPQSATEAERAGLIPGASPNILAGTVAFTRRNS